MTPHTIPKTVLRLSAAALAALWLVLWPAALDAQQHPNLERGFAHEKLYQFGGIDNVNVLNGNVALTIPIGMAYPAGGNLTYALTLTYNEVEIRAARSRGTNLGLDSIRARWRGPGALGFQRRWAW